MMDSSEHLRALVDSILAGVVVVDDRGAVRAMNLAAERLFGRRQDELVGHSVRAIIPALELPTGAPGPRPAAEPARARLGAHRDGTTIPLELHLSEMRAGAERYHVLTIGVISAHTPAEARLRYRLELESTVADISRRFVHADGASLDATIDWALARMGDVTGVDRGYVFQFSEDGATFRNTHEWCAEGIAPQIQDLARLVTADFQSMLSVMERGEMVYVPRAADLPDSQAQLRALLLAGGIQSYIKAPIIWDGRLRGYLGFDAVREVKRFPEEDIRLLGTVAEIMGRALANHQAALRVAENAWFLENLDRVTRLFARNEDIHTLLGQLAELLLEIFQADRAWYIFPCDPSTTSFRVPVEATRPEYPGSFAHGLEMPMDDVIRGLMRAALAENVPITLDVTAMDDPPPIATDYSIKSLMIMVAQPRNETAWVLGLHQCSHARQWNAAERRLFQAIGERMGDALSIHLAHQELRLNKERLAIVLRSNPAIIYTIALTSPVRCTYISPNVEHILGYTVDEVISTPDWLRPVIHPDDHDRTFASLQASLQSTGRTSSIYRARKKDGEYLWVQDQLAMHPDDPQQAIGCMIDISQRISVEQELEHARAAAEQALATARDRLHLLQMAEQLAHIGHWQANLLTGAVSWSDEMYRIHGLSPDGATPPDMQTLMDTYYEFDKDVVEGIVAKAMAIRGVVRTELKLKRADGSMRWLLSFTRPELDEHGNIIGSFGISQDITELKEIEAALVEAREQALAASRVKSQFLANMSHEIRTPLNGVLGMTELLLDTPLSDDQRELLEMVRTSGRSLYELIEDVLDISKIEAGKIELQAVPFSLRDVVQDAARMVAVRAYEKGLELVVDVAPEAPGRVIGDPVRFRQILTNLLANAVKFTPRGEVELDVCRGPEGGIAIRVRDTGIGIPSERRDAIFEAFTQADSSTTREYGGTGLGLAICRELVERMGGRIWVEQAAGGGSVFHVAMALPEVEDDGAPHDAPPLLAGARVLVVEGNATTARVLSRLLYSWHMEPMVCANESEAFSALYEALYQDRPFRFGLIDAALGTRSGVELARTLARDSRFAAMARILLVSASWRPDPALLSSDVVSRCLVKPISPSTLLDALLTYSAAAAAPPVGRSSEAAPRSIPAPGLRVLLAEDNPMNALLIKRVLARSECSVVHVTTGTGALTAWERQRFDIILMDMQMPELDGLEATRRIRGQEHERGVRTPIVALTANAMKEDEQRCLDAGMDGYLPKPIEIGRLLQVLERIPRQRARARVFDARALLDQVGEDDETAALLVASFLDSEPAALAGLEAIVAAGDLEALARAAHHARGSLLALHAQPAAAAALELELAAKQRDVERIPARMADLRDAWRRLVDELEASFGQA